MRKLFLFCLLFFSQFIRAQDNFDVPGSFYPFPVQSGWGFVDQTGASVTSEVFDTVLVDNSLLNFYGFIAVNNKGKYGFLQTYDEVQTLIPFEYDTAFYVPKGIVVGYKRTYKFIKVNAEDVLLKETNLGSIDRFYLDNETLYTYSSGGAGVLKNGNFLSTKCSHLIAFDTKTAFQSFANADFWLVSNGEKLGLYGNNQLIIPCVAESIQPFNAEFIRYWIGYWVYVRVLDSYVIDPKGTRVQIYSGNLWKIYDSEMKNATLFENGKKKFGSQYEDYFPVEENVFAVRKNNLIGTIDWDGNVQIPLAFDQITSLHNGFYKCLKDEEWFLTDGRGVKLSQKGYDQIFSYGERRSEAFIIKKNNFCGLIDLKGKELLPCEFDDISNFRSIYLTYSNGFLNLFDSLGSKLTSEKYLKYDFDKSLMIMFLDENRFDVFSKAGKLNAEPLLQAYFFDEIVKGYSLGELEIMSYDKSTGILEENQRYPNVKSFEIKEVKAMFHKKNLLRNSNKSHLEENQLTGKFGFRGNWTSKLLIAPVYTEVVKLDFEYWACIESFNSRPFKLTNSNDLKVLFDYDIISSSNAGLVEDNVISNTYIHDKVVYGTSVSTNRVIYNSDGKARFDQSNAFKDQNISDANYSNHFVVYNINGEFEPATERFNSTSLFDLYTRRNILNNIGFDKAQFDRLLNPSARVTLKGGIWTSIPEIVDEKAELSSALKNKKYKEFVLFESAFNESISFISRNDQGKYFWSSISNDTTVNANFYKITPKNNEYFEVEDKPFRTGFIHVLEPQFIYLPNDTTQYINGRIIRKTEAGVQLFSVKDSLLNPICFEQILPFHTNGFKAKTNNTWLLLDRDGQQLTDLRFAEISEKESGLFEVVLNDRHLLLNDRFEELANLGSYRSVNDTLFQQKTGEDLYLWNPISNVRDTLRNGEELLKMSSFVFGKQKGKNYVRLFGSDHKINVGLTKPEVEKSYVLSRIGKYYELIDGSGQILVNKKKLITDYIVNGDFICLKSEKNWMLYNFQGENLYSGKKGKSINFLNDCCVLEFQEETIALQSDGSKLSVDEVLARKKTTPIVKSLYQVEKNPVNLQYGVTDSTGRWTIPANYKWISPLSENEFSVHLPSRKGLMASIKEEVLPTDFDAFYPVDYQTWLVRLDNRYGIYDQNLGWIVPIR